MSKAHFTLLYLLYTRTDRFGGLKQQQQNSRVVSPEKWHLRLTSGFSIHMNTYVHQHKHILAYIYAKRDINTETDKERKQLAKIQAGDKNTHEF